MHDSPEDLLFSIASRIPGLQHRVNKLSSQSSSATQTDASGLAEDARGIDRQLATWCDDLFSTRPYSIASDINVSTQHDFTLRHVHRYSDFYSARMWNLYRVARLIVQSVLNRAVSWTSASPRVSGGLDGTGTAENLDDISKSLVNEICATVPFLLGQDLSKMNLPTGHATGIHQPAPHATSTSTAHTGRFSLIWPLHVASSCPSVPETQRRWMRAQLQAMAEQGEAQAAIVSLTESRILLGGKDMDRFDCV